MARISTKENKSIYQLRREELGLSREKASELLEGIPPERIERIESGKFTAHPDEVILMADKYNAPQLCNHYCANECEIGKQYVPEIKIKDLSQIVLEMLASAAGPRTEIRLVKAPADAMQRPVLTQALKRRYLMIAKTAQHVATRGIEIANAIGMNALIPT